MKHKYELWITWSGSQLVLAVINTVNSPIIADVIKSFGVTALDKVYTLIEVN